LHTVEVEAVRCRRIVGIRIDNEAGALEQRTMILPARIADPYLRAGRELAQEIGADLESARATQCLDRYAAT
jgi:hypothetical protein